MITALNLNQLARMSTESMLNCMLEGIAIGLFAWILLRVVGRRNSSTRFAVWFFALLAIAALPVLGIAASGLGQTGRAASAITVPSSWALDLFIAWAVIAGISLLRVGLGLLQLRKLRASYTPIDAATLDPLLRETLQEFEASRPVALCHSERIQIPAAIGFLKPTVVLPSWALQELSTAELNSILIHELAHLRRRDDWTNLAQQIFKALLFFHPAVWWIGSQLALEREMACDDAVLAATRNPRGYAQCLVAMAEKSFLHRGLALAQAVVNRMRHTSLRVSQILDVNRSGATRIWRPALYSIAAFFVVCLVSFSHAPELIAFQEQMPDVAIASAIPASGTLSAVADPHFLAKQAVATAASFRVKSSEPIDRPGTDRPNTNLVAKPGSAQRSGPRQKPASMLEARLVPQSAEKLRQARSTTTSDEAAPQAIFVVMQTSQYDEAGPTFFRITVWRVTVLDSTRIPAETRIPAKQI